MCDGVNAETRELSLLASTAEDALTEPTVAHDGATHARGAETQLPILVSRDLMCEPCAGPVPSEEWVSRPMILSYGSGHLGLACSIP
jgi:hypothetical protein